MVAIPPQKRMTVLKGSARLAEAREFIQDVLARSPFPEAERRMVALAVCEALERIVEHARQDGRSVEGIDLSVDLDETRIEIRITDERNDFYREAIDPEHALQSRLGLFLVRQIMDEVEYVYRRGLENLLVMVKFTP